jgi:cytidine deaminase
VNEVSDIRIVGFKLQAQVDDKLLTILEDVEMVAIVTDDKGHKWQARGTANLMAFKQVQVPCNMCKDGLDEFENARSALTHLCKFCGGSKIRNL